MDLGLNYQVTYTVCKRTLTIDIHVSYISLHQLKLLVIKFAMNESNVQAFVSQAED